MKTAICLALIVLGGTAGDLALAHAMRRGGGATPFGVAGVSTAFRRASRLTSMWIGLALQAVAFAALLALLSWADVSFVVPATALSYTAGATGAKLFLNEHVTGRRWAGVLLISSGVLLVLVG
jgi:drug/metabolite transporter (DMT)-like permease